MFTPTNNRKVDLQGFQFNHISYYFMQKSQLCIEKASPESAGSASPGKGSKAAKHRRVIAVRAILPVSLLSVSECLSQPHILFIFCVFFACQFLDHKLMVSWSYLLERSGLQRFLSWINCYFCTLMLGSGNC